MEKEKNIPTNINLQTPLLEPNGTHKQVNHSNIDKNQDDQKQNQVKEEQSQQENTNVVVNVDGEEDATKLDKYLQYLEFYLRILGFDQTNFWKLICSWVVFCFVGIAVPVLIIEKTHSPECEDYQVKDFEYEILTSHLLLSGVSLICVAYNIRNKGFRNFLFVDRLRGYTVRFKDHYIKKIMGFYRLLFLSLIPCCILKAVHEIVRMIFVQKQSWGLAIVYAAILILSWIYLSVISLAACMLFHLACNLQVVHFNDYKNFLEKESSIITLIEEHKRLREHLSKISHRFRVYLILVFLIVTASLCMTLVQITGVNGKITFLNGGNFAVTSIIQVVETLICLHAGTKITSRAQSIGAVACKWHALVTCGSLNENKRSVSLSSLSSNYSENDLCSLDEKSIVSQPAQPLSASVSSYNQRQSFVLYLQSNPGGLTLYGWTVDRSLLATIFAVELSLVLFVLGQTIVFSSPAE